MTIPATRAVRVATVIPNQVPIITTFVPRVSYLKVLADKLVTTTRHTALSSAGVVIAVVAIIAVFTVLDYTVSADGAA